MVQKGKLAASACIAPASKFVMVLFPTFGKPTKPMERSFFGRENRAALVSPAGESSFFFLGGMFQFADVRVDRDEEENDID